jgi:hypothetical protein
MNPLFIWSKYSFKLIVLFPIDANPLPKLYTFESSWMILNPFNVRKESILTLGKSGLVEQRKPH